MSRKEYPIPFKIVKIDENQFSVFEEVLKLKAEIRQKIGYGFGANIEDHSIGVAMSYVLLREGRPLLKQDITCYFEIQEDAFKGLMQDDKVILPSDFGKHLAMITTGTVRGALFANTKNTPFHQFFMGIINVDKIFQEDISIEI